MTQTAETRQPRTMTDRVVQAPLPPAESHGQRGRRMIAEMSNVRTLQWVGIALVVHIAIIVGTSFGFIVQCVKQHTFHPADLAAAAPASPAAPAATPAGTVAPGTAAPAAVPAPAASAQPAMSDDEKHLADLKKNGNPEAKKLTETSAPGELPKGPSHGFKISEDP